MTRSFGDLDFNLFSVFAISHSLCIIYKFNLSRIYFPLRLLMSPVYWIIQFPGRKPLGPFLILIHTQISFQRPLIITGLTFVHRTPSDVPVKIFSARFLPVLFELLGSEVSYQMNV